MAPQLYERGLYKNKNFGSITHLEKSAERILCASAFMCPSMSLSHVLLGVQCSVTVVVPDMSCVPCIREAGSYVMFVR